jgi:hypothetical protein
MFLCVSLPTLISDRERDFAVPLKSPKNLTLLSEVLKSSHMRTSLAFVHAAAAAHISQE